jgi:signal transduction histidine kinase
MPKIYESIKIHMRSSTQFDFAALQIKHPDAFFLRLSYSRLKVHGAFQNLRFVAYLNILCLTLGLITSFLSVMLDHFLFQQPRLAFNIAMLVMSALCYSYVWYAQYQASYSSKRFAKGLQNCLYIQIGIFSALLFNLYILHSDWLIIACMLFMALSSVCAVLTEPLFHDHSAVVDHVKLQKIRQLAYWAHLQIKKQKDAELKNYYKNLHQDCLKQERQLLEKIRFNSFKEYYMQ